MKKHETEREIIKRAVDAADEIICQASCRSINGKLFPVNVQKLFRLHQGVARRSAEIADPSNEVNKLLAAWSQTKREIQISD